MRKFINGELYEISFNCSRGICKCVGQFSRIFREDEINYVFFMVSTNCNQPCVNLLVMNKRNGPWRAKRIPKSDLLFHLSDCYKSKWFDEIMRGEK